jgi:hypothetical protein
MPIIQAIEIGRKGMSFLLSIVVLVNTAKFHGFVD